MSDATIARIGRNLADALSAFARSRSAEDKKIVAGLHTELCAAVVAEREEAEQVKEDQT